MLIDSKKLISMMLVFVLVINMILFGMGKIDPVFFWGSIVVIYLVSKFYVNK